MRKVIRASVLVLVLAVPTFAGEIPYNVTSPPPPTNSTAQGEMQNGVAGDIPNDVTGDIPYDVTPSSVLISLLVALIA
jgi:hypothetical protein